MKIQNLLIGLALIGAVACSSSKEQSNLATQDVEVNVPCSGLEYVTSSEYFRASAMGISTSLETSKMKAMSAARSQLSLDVEATVKVVADNYVSSYEENANEEARGRYQSLSREAANQTLRGVSTICQKTMQAPDGKYKTYVAIELSAGALVEEIQGKISSDSKLRTDFEYEKFKEVFESEMSELSGK